MVSMVMLMRLAGLDSCRGFSEAGWLAVLSSLLLLRLMAGQSAGLLSAGLQEVLSLLPGVQVTHEAEFVWIWLEDVGWDLMDFNLLSILSDPWLGLPDRVTPRVTWPS